MPAPPASALDSKARVEDHNSILQQVLDEMEGEGKKKDKKKRKKHKFDDRIYSWRHYYKRPKWKDFEPDSKLADKLESAPPPPPRRFKDRTPGEVMLVLLREAHARGCLTDIRAGFTKERDSAGRPWGKKPKDLVNHKFKPKTTMLEVARWMAESNHAEARMDGRVLKLYQPDSSEFKPDVLLAPGKNIIEQPTKASHRERASHVFVQSESGVHGWVGDPKIRKKIGRRVEASLDIGPVKYWEVAHERGLHYLRRHGNPKHARILKVVPGAGADPYKGNYKIGDEVLLMENGIPSRHRVRQIALNWETDGSAEINLVLSDKLIHPDVKQHRRMRSLTGKTAMTSPALSQLTGSETPTSDGEAPPVPSMPIITVRNGVGEIYWDGKDESANVPPWDQAYVELHIGLEEDFKTTDLTYHSSLAYAGTVTVNFPDYDTAYYAKFIAVDQGGDASSPSEEVVIRVPKVTSDDIQPGAVGPDQLDPDLGIGTDGLAPANAPTDLVVRGFPRSLVATHSGITNADPVYYRYHITTDDTTVASAATVAPGQEAVGSTMTQIEKYTDDEPLVMGQQYFVAVEARDDDVLPVNMGPVSIWVPGQLDPAVASEIAAESIDGIHLKAVVALLGQITTALTGQRWTASNEGMFMYDSNNQSIVNFPTSGDALTMTAHLVMLSALAQNGIQLDGVSRLVKGAQLILESAVQESLIPPGLEISWPTQEVEQDIVPEGKRGLYWDSTTSHWFFCLALGTGIGSSINEHDTSGNHIFSYPITSVGGFNIDAQGGITKLGTNFYVLGKHVNASNDTVWNVYRFPAASLSVISNNADAEWEYTNTNNLIRPTIGNNATNLLIARTFLGDGKIHIDEYATTGGSSINSVTTDLSPGNQELTSIHYIPAGTGGLSSNRYVIGNRGGNNTLVWVFGTAGAYQTNESWPVANNATVQGIGFNGSDFFHLSEGGHIVQYLTTNAFTTESAKWWAWYTKYDSAGTVHETPRSPSATVTMKRRARLLISMPSLPAGGADDPDGYRVLLGRGSSEPATTAVWLQSGNVTASPWTKTIDAATFSGTSWSSINSTRVGFPASTPGIIKSSDGTKLMDAGGLPRLRLSKGVVSTSHGVTPTAIGWDSEQVDTEGWYSGSGSVIIPTYTCHAIVIADCVWAINGTNRRGLVMQESSDSGANYSDMPALQDHNESPNSNEVTPLRIAHMVELTAGHWYRVVRYQNSGAALNMNSARLAITPLGPT